MGYITRFEYCLFPAKSCAMHDILRIFSRIYGMNDLVIPIMGV